jgi:hypothetical protein
VTPVAERLENGALSFGEYRKRGVVVGHGGRL